jgi:hypothetical protein
MATVDDLRNHLLDDAIELMETLGIVTPLVTTANVKTPAQLLLRRLLARHVILVLTRMHATAGTGRSGITASIDGVLEAAAKNSLLSATEISQFKTRRAALQKDMEPDGVSFTDINLFRNTELAHSLHPHTANRPGLSWYVIHAFADGTYKLVQDMEAELVKSGAPALRTLPTDKWDEWVDHGRALWKCEAARPRPGRAQFQTVEIG